MRASSGYMGGPCRHTRRTSHPEDIGRARAISHRRESIASTREGAGASALRVPRMRESLSASSPVLSPRGLTLAIGRSIFESERIAREWNPRMPIIIDRE